jgi:hypothetical protein
MARAKQLSAFADASAIGYTPSAQAHSRYPTMLIFSSATVADLNASW